MEILSKVIVLIVVAGAAFIVLCLTLLVLYFIVRKIKSPNRNPNSDALRERLY